MGTLYIVLLPCQGSHALARSVMHEGRSGFTTLLIVPLLLPSHGIRRDAAAAAITRSDLSGWSKQPSRFTFRAELIRRELQYKRDAHREFVTRFGARGGRELFDAGDLSAVAEGLSKLYQATNIPFRFEIMAASDGLRDVHAAGRLLDGLLLFLDRPDAESFDRFASAVGSLPAPAEGSRVLTWPNVTILPFLADPTRFMVLKRDLSRRICSGDGH